MRPSKKSKFGMLPVYFLCNINYLQVMRGYDITDMRVFRQFQLHSLIAGNPSSVHVSIGIYHRIQWPKEMKHLGVPRLRWPLLAP